MVLMKMNSEKEISSELTISDLKILNNIIDMVASKGLIKPADYSTVGSIYDKISSLLKSVSDLEKLDE